MIQPDEQMIWHYLDGNLDEESKQQLEKKIAEDAEVKVLFEKITSLDQLLRTQQIEQPSLRFSKNLMEKIGSMEKVTPDSVSLIPRFTSARVSLIVISLSIFSILISGIIPAVYYQTHLFPETFSNDTISIFFWAIVAFWGVILFDRWKTHKIANHS
ncbi:MAG: hypothetical protein R3D00_04190 [Bacteroidia bacterium]